MSLLFPHSTESLFLAGSQDLMAGTTISTGVAGVHGAHGARKIRRWMGCRAFIATISLSARNIIWLAI
jgi:hypothetical protein